METPMQPRNNSRNQPTRTVNMTIRCVSEAYGCTETDDKRISRRDIVYYSIWILLTAGLIVLAITTYPPSLALLLVEIMIGILFSGGINIIKARKL